MSNQLSTYSGMDTNLTFTHPLIGAILADGVSQKGIDQVNVRMGVDQSVVKAGMDGAVVPSVIPGDYGEIEVQVWQTSTLYDQFLAWYNLLRAARDGGDVSNWFSGTMVIVNVVDGTSHTCRGVGPKKIPDKTYQKEAQVVSWTFVACDIATE